MFTKKKKSWHKKKINPIFLVGLVFLVAIGGFSAWKTADKVNEQDKVDMVAGDFPKKSVPVEAKPTEQIPEVQQETPQQSVYPIILTNEQASSITVVVNKKYKLPSNYAPGGLRSEASNALDRMFVAAQAQGLSPKIVSGYRSYNAQVNVYGGYVEQYGQAQADTFSARPGHSEHQTGLAVDVGNADGSCELEICFGTTALGEWTKTNAYVYGFIVRYPEGKESQTGYQYEPWHLRFVGDKTARAMDENGQTMDEYFGVAAGGY